VEPVSTRFPRLALALGSKARAEAGARSPLKRILAILIVVASTVAHFPRAAVSTLSKAGVPLSICRVMRARATAQLQSQPSSNRSAAWYIDAVFLAYSLPGAQYGPFARTEAAD